jgi:hypothetical protein
MPAYSTLRTFIDSLRTGRTNITTTFDALLLDRAALREHPEWPTFRDTPVLNGPMPQWLRNILSTAGIRDIEIIHIDQHWPAAQKELARQWIAAAIEEDVPLSFSWELHDGTDPVNEQREEGRRIVFRSPRDGVRISGLNVWYVHIGGVHVNR